MKSFNILQIVVCLFVCACVVHAGSVENSDNEALKKQVQLLETMVEQQFDKMQDLTARVDQMEQRLQNMEESEESMREKMSHGREWLTGLETMNDTEEIRDPDDDYMIDMDLLSACHNLTQLRTCSKQWSDYRIAFHAYQSTNRCYSNKEMIQYDVETMDFGGGYTPVDGVFDAPTSGVYVFTWTAVTTKQTGWFVSQLIVDGEVRGSITSDSDSVGYTRGGIHPATGVVATYVEAGKHVYIQMIQVTGACGTVKSDGMVRSTFSGWLLF
ncbi:hypothetical protein ACF0H5_023010 [Mactra antiquata]